MEVLFYGIKSHVKRTGRNKNYLCTCRSNRSSYNYPIYHFLHYGQQGDIRMALRTKIKEYREKAGLKQADLAELVNARRETIVHLENGRYNPSLKLAMDIAKVFSVTVEELFEFVDDEKN